MKSHEMSPSMLRQQKKKEGRRDEGGNNRGKADFCASTGELQFAAVRENLLKNEHLSLSCLVSLFFSSMSLNHEDDSCRDDGDDDDE